MRGGMGVVLLEPPSLSSLDVLSRQAACVAHNMESPVDYRRLARPHQGLYFLRVEPGGPGDIDLQVRRHSVHEGQMRVELSAVLVKVEWVAPAMFLCDAAVRCYLSSIRAPLLPPCIVQMPAPWRIAGHTRRETGVEEMGK